MPQANSTTSRPRATSPAASLATLPCSSDDELRQLGRVVLDQLAEREQDRGALGERDAAPGLGRFFGDADRVADVLPAGEVDGAADVPGGWVVDVAPALGFAGPGLAADPVGDVLVLRVGCHCLRACSRVDRAERVDQEAETFARLVLGEGERRGHP